MTSEEDSGVTGSSGSRRAQWMLDMAFIVSRKWQVATLESLHLKASSIIQFYDEYFMMEKEKSKRWQT